MARSIGKRCASLRTGTLYRNVSPPAPAVASAGLGRSEYAKFVSSLSITRKQSQPGFPVLLGIHQVRRRESFREEVMRSVAMPRVPRPGGSVGSRPGQAQRTPAAPTPCSAGRRAVSMALVEAVLFGGGLVGRLREQQFTLGWRCHFWQRLPQLPLFSGDGHSPDQPHGVHPQRAGLLHTLRPEKLGRWNARPQRGAG